MHSSSLTPEPTIAPSDGSPNSLFDDVKNLLGWLHRPVDQGNSMIVIEHNLDVIKTADWAIDLGPEGGNGGGRVIAMGTPEDVAANGDSWTGRYLRGVLAAH